MTEPKKNGGKSVGRFTTNDAMPHNLVVAVANGIANGVAGGITGALVLSKLNQKPTRGSRKKD